MQEHSQNRDVRRWLGLFLSLLIVPACASAEPGKGRLAGEPAPVHIEDVLATEFFGRAEFSPDGRWLAYNQAPPYASLSDFSYWMRAGGLSGHQLWVMDLGAGGAPFLQPGLDPRASNFLFAVSPGSGHIVVLEHLSGRLRVVACRPGEDACVRFEPMPDIRDRYVAAVQWNERVNWITPDRFVMPVRRPGLPGSEMRSRASAGAFLWKAWNDAWEGSSVTASAVTSTGRDRAGDWAEGELAVFDLSAGTVDVLAAGRHAGPAVSPDCRHVLVARVAERSRPAADAGSRARDTHPIFDRRYGLRLIDLATGDARNLETPFHVDPGSLTWRADAGAFAAFGWSRDAPPEGGQFYLFDVSQPLPVPAGPKDFQLTARVPDPAGRWWTGPAPAAFIGDRLAVHGREKPDGQPGWYLLGAGGSASRLSGPGGVPDAVLAAVSGEAVVAASGGTLYSLAADRAPLRIEVPGAVRPFEYRPDPEHGLSGEAYPMPGLSPKTLSREIILLAEGGPGQPAAVVFAEADAGPVPPEPIQLPGPGWHVLAASKAAGAVAATFKSGAATRLVLVRRGEPPTELARINDHLNRVRHPDTREIRYVLSQPGTAGTSRTVDACLLLPPGFDPSRRYPVLMEIYPAGSGGGCGTLADAPSAGPMVADLWAARGFIYVRPAFPLDLMRAPDDPLGGLGSLVDQTIDALAAEGFADPGRVVVYGFSQGGIASLAAAVRSDRPAAVISMNGWANYLSHYFGARGLMRYFHLDQNGGDNRWRYECLGEGVSHGCPFGFGMPASSDPAAFALASPVAGAGQITAPVLLVHSDFDYFDMAQYDEMFGALYRAGKEATYVRYWGEGHGLSSPANIRDLWNRIDAFLEAEEILPADQPPPP